MNNTRNARQVIAEARDLSGGNGILPSLPRDAALGLTWGVIRMLEGR
jgi:hypothetical protein